MSKERIANTYDLVATTFDRIGPRFFSHSGRRLVEWVQIPEGIDVLDVATGRGAVLLPAAERVGRHGRVVGVDRSAGMVREVAADARREGLGQVAICQMEAERLGFAEGSFDLVLCGHAIFYFPQACLEFHRVLRPQGRVGLTVIAKGCLDWVFQVLDHHVPDEGAGEEEAEEGAPINTPEGIAEVMSRAGFEDVQVMVEETDFLYKDEAEWWAALETTGVRWSLEWVEPGKVDGLKAEMSERLQDFRRHDGIHIPHRVLHALGRKAASREIKPCPPIAY
jgi:ubiquinone/menaquinone biosynthesis C-methylase UbiE